MPTEKPKIIFVADKDLLKRIDDFRYVSRISNRSKAIRHLLEKALQISEAFPLHKTEELIETLKKTLDKQTQTRARRQTYSVEELFGNLEEIEKKVSAINKALPTVNPDKDT